MNLTEALELIEQKIEESSECWYAGEFRGEMQELGIPNDADAICQFTMGQLRNIEIALRQLWTVEELRRINIGISAQRDAANELLVECSNFSNHPAPEYIDELQKRIKKHLRGNE